jgi:tryptophan synthase beta chain
MLQTKYLLNESQMPKFWYNIQADLPKPLPAVLHPGTLQPMGPDDLAPLFPMELILQEVSTEREIEIPEPVRDIYKLWRPAPLYRAHRLEKALGTPAKIFYKYEGVSPAGSHKPNTAVPQAFYNAAGRRQAPDHRDRRRPVGHLAGLCRATCSGWRCWCSRCACPTTRSPTAAP